MVELYDQETELEMSDTAKWLFAILLVNAMYVLLIGYVVHEFVTH